MKKQTIVDQIEIQRDGSIQVRFAKEVIDDDGSVLAREWHRTSLMPGQDIDAQMAAVSQNLVNDLNFPAVGAGCIARTKTAANAFWTAKVVSDYRAKLASEAAAMEARRQP